jgi:hypothetical protein
MVFGDNPPFTIVVTTCFKTPLLTSEMGQSPISGMIQLFRTPSQSSIVSSETGLRLRERTR